MIPIYLSAFGLYCFPLRGTFIFTLMGCWFVCGDVDVGMIRGYVR